MTLDPGPALGALVGYALSTGLIRPDDERWAVNQVLEVLRLDSPGSYDGSTATTGSARTSCWHRCSPMPPAAG